MVDAHGEDALIALIDEREGRIGAVDPQARGGERSRTGLEYGEGLYLAGSAVLPVALAVAIVDDIPLPVEAITRIEEDVTVNGVAIAPGPKRDEYRAITGDRDIGERGRALVCGRLAGIVDEA